MTSKKTAVKEREDSYETTFSKQIEYVVSDFISESFLYGIIDAIAERMNLKEAEVKSKFSLENGVSVRTKGKSNIKKLLHDSQKYGHHISSLEIESGIVYGNDRHTHFDLSFSLFRYGKNAHAHIRCYAVADDRNNSQSIINWGNGTLSDFQSISLLETQPLDNDFIIKLNDGSIVKWCKGDSVQKVEVVNQVSIVPSKWSDKSIVVAIVIGLITVAITLWAVLK